ncbi:MAG: biotin carboxylase N-terminal domain-containing protein [Myxococcales bacterium]|nr:biotin carboxylase N-terminal domain-containing protein [Myxococcales bacterium]
MPIIERVLVANRGEIALRIMRTVRRMGLSSVAVFSDADASAHAVRFADTAVRIGPNAAKDSYLRVDAILAAAKKTGADAIHPGFGFLSENPDFAQAVIDAGIVFIGPTPKAIRAMGLKREAKALVGKRGVPLLPGFDGGDQSTALLKSKALEIGLPVIFKPSAGGGGKGMKIARSADELDACIESGRREAQSAFGDPTLIIEKYLERPRHLEVQLLGDTHGNLVHLFERECSLQRRHQKVVEETPSPALTPALREQLCQAALEVGRAVDYTNAGTVEFIMDEAGRFSFSEMNTRLQVEHRVTEQVTGLDLVEQQIRVARGERLAFSQGDVKQRGHAVQVRLYAEDPANQFLPSIGPVLDFWTPPFGGLTVDAGIESGGAVSPHYDPMIAKLIVHAETREQSFATLARSLDHSSVLGLTTNKGFLARLLRHPAVVSGALSTSLIAEQMDRLAEPVDLERDRLAAVAATLFSFAARREHDDFLPTVTTGFRNNRFRDQRHEWKRGADELAVSYRDLGSDSFVVTIGESKGQWRIASRCAPCLDLEDPDGVVHRLRVVVDGDTAHVHTPRGDVVLREVPSFPSAGDEAIKGGFIAPMPGKVVKVNVKDGDTVKRGQALLVLEAMKMEQTTTSPDDGVVKQVLVREGDQVTAGQVLIVMEA